VTDWKLQTRAAKTYLDTEKKVRPLSLPIYQAVNFQAASSAGMGDDFRNGTDNVYQRFGHPNSSAAGERIAALEGAEAGLVFSSGMGAISTTLMALAGHAGAHVVAQREIFAQTFTFLDGTLRGLGVETTFVPADELHGVAKYIRGNTALIYIESPSNPLLKVVDIEAAARVAREHNIPLLIDSTFASPWLQNPIAHGADVVLHSATKFLGGHSDVQCGAVVSTRERIARIKQMQILLGSVLDPHASWLLLRGIKTLGLRVQRQADSALRIAEYLSKHPAVSRVSYPFLPGSRTHELARKQMRGGGGVLSFELKGGREVARKFADELELIVIATSLGGVESIIEIPADLDFSEDEFGEATHTGISPGLIRLSVGVEDVEDLLADIENALVKTAAAVSA
jgi:cystathionine beta-lyase/cystathionine gamma-synthase